MRKVVTLLGAGTLLSLVLAGSAQAQLRIYLGDEEQQRQQQQQQQQPQLQGGFERASNLIGAAVESRQGENLGTLSDVIFDPQQGAIAYGVITRGGVLGVGSKLYAVPWQLFSVSGAQDRVILNLSRSRLDNAPGFTRENWPDMASSSWQRRISDYYGVRPMAGGYGAGGQQMQDLVHGQRFNPDSIETFSGRIATIWHSHGRTDLVHANVRTGDGQVVHVDFGPSWYLQNYGVDLKEGDEVTVRGSRIYAEGRNFLIASSLRTENQRLRLRDRDGSPLWTQQGQQFEGQGSQQQFDRSHSDEGHFRLMNYNPAAPGALRLVNDKDDDKYMKHSDGDKDKKYDKDAKHYDRDTKYYHKDKDADVGRGGSVAATGTIKGSDLMDKSIRSNQGDRLAGIDNLAIDLNTGRVLYVIVGMGGKYIAIPWQALSYDTNRDSFVLNMSKDRLEAAPSFDRDSWPDFTSTDFQTRTNRYFNVQSGTGFDVNVQPQDRFGTGGSLQKDDFDDQHRIHIKDGDAKDQHRIHIQDDDVDVND